MKVATRNTPVQSWRENIRRLPAWLVLSALAAALVVVIFLATNFGTISIPASVIARILLNSTGLFHFTRQWAPGTETIVLHVPMPCFIGSALVAAALATAWVVF